MGPATQAAVPPAQGAAAPAVEARGAGTPPTHAVPAELGGGAAQSGTAQSGAALQAGTQMLSVLGSMLKTYGQAQTGSTSTAT